MFSVFTQYAFVLPEECNFKLSSRRLTEQYSRIIQFEDDPEQLYHQIRESGLCLGMQIDSVRHENGSLTFNADGNKKKIPLITASHIRVEPISEEDILPASGNPIAYRVKGALIWLLANVTMGGASLAEQFFTIQIDFQLTDTR